MGYYAVYRAIFNTIKTVLEAKSNIKQVVLGAPPVIRDLPLALINPDTTEIGQAAIGSLLENRITVEVILILRETEPANWFDEIIVVMGDVVDAVLADRTLAGAAKDIIPIIFAPGEVRMGNSIYYGGLVRFQALVFYAP